MARKCVRYKKVDEFKKSNREVSSSNVEVYIDVESEKKLKEVVEFLVSIPEKRYKRIFTNILSHQYLPSLYKREGDGVTVIKKTGQERLYCKEIFKNGKKVVLIAEYTKKVEKNQQDKVLKNLIDRIKKYEYEFG